MPLLLRVQQGLQAMLVSFLGVLSVNAAGQAGLLATEDDYFSEIPLVSSATRLNQSLLDTPSSITIIDRAMIEASGFTQVADLFRLVPGFQVTYAAGYLPVVNYHGQSDQFPSRLEVQIDGRSVYRPSLSSINWAFLGIELADIERIEIVRGSNAPAHGMNAFKASINIITHQPFEVRGNYLEATAGAVGTRTATARQAGNWGALDYRISLGYQRDDGFDERFDRKQVRQLSFRGSYNPAPADHLDLQVGYTEGDNGVEGADPFTVPLHSRDVDSHFQSLRWTHLLDDGAELVTHFHHNRYWDNDEYSMQGPLSELLGVDPALIPLLFDGQPDQILRLAFFDGTAERYDLEIQYAPPADNRINYVVGAGSRLDRRDSDWLLNGKGTVEDLSGRLFGNTEIQLTDKLKLNAGAIIEHNQIVGIFGAGRLALNFRLDPAQVLRLGAGYTERSPSLQENNWNFYSRFNDGTRLEALRVSADHLDTEELITYELAYVGHWLDSRLSIDLKAFREEIRNSISGARDPEFPDIYGVDGSAVTLNGGHIDTQGFEGQIRYQHSPADFIAFQFSLADSDTRYLRSVNPVVFRDRDDATPAQTLSVLASRKFTNGIQASAGFYRISEMLWLGEGDLIESYNRIDVRLAKQFRLDSSHLLVELIGQNLGDTYEEYQQGNDFDTRVYLRASLTDW